MNNQQRTFLIEKLEKTTKNRIDALEKSKPDRPVLENYLLKAIHEKTIKIRSDEELIEKANKFALNRESARSWRNDKPFDWFDVFEIPEDYILERDRIDEQRNKIAEEIRATQIQTDGLVTRIRLASDKTLQKMIDEVDDMGDLKLMDIKIRELSAPYERKLLDQ